MASVGLVAHLERPQALELQEQTVRWLQAQGHEARRLDVAGESVTGEPCAHPDDLADLDLVVSLGGDGTMLRSVDLAAPVGVPVLGVNLGHLGYLTAVEPGELEGSLKRFLAGDYSIDRRMTLEVSIPSVGPKLALNDIVLQRLGGGHTIRLRVRVNGLPFVAFAADALIVATPTGSTAYNLSARGPIVSPRARAQILTPVAPHSLFDRSVVLAPEERIAIETFGGRTADLVIDGAHAGQVEEGQTVEIGAGRDAQLVIFQTREFPQIVTHKFDLGTW